MSSQTVDVIVVGCGASGIAALRRLHEAGLNAIGLEAADRIGGRVCSVEFGLNVVDVGAAWCHGEKDNIVFELAEPFGLLGRPEAGQHLYLNSSGNFVDDGATFSKALGDAVSAAYKTGDGSILKCVQEAATKIKQLQNDPELKSGLVEWFSRSNHLGGQRDPTEGKSLRGLEEFWPCAGEDLLNWKGRGYKTILDVLLKSYPDPAKKIPISIFTNKEVENISWNSTEGYKSDERVQVRCTDGSVYAGKSVIVTVSVGVLKERHEKLFKPPLPKQKVTALRTLQMSILDKIYIEFSSPWWESSMASIDIIWREVDKNMFEPQEKWITEIHGFFTVSYQPNVLLTWIYGEGAKQMEDATDENIKKGIEKLSHVVLRKQFDVTPIKNILRTKWASNPLVRGAYAYRSVATEQQGGFGAKTLSEPLIVENQPVVCFAGEATSWHRHSAVHGAIEAGFREADRLIDCLKGLK